ncbi:hypothetical protein CFP56_020066 [Quercus suber]|uniref:Aminotransferase-like plant mobile domain-containing protein n=1 Tax=Quercus suber TaxID=58331 RepID=A0AAW0KGK9_QUESU
MAHGESLAVGAMCLSNLYNHLDALHISEMKGSPYYAMVTHLNLALLQVWAWEYAFPLVTHASSVTAIQVKSPLLSWVELMDREANFIWIPYISVAGFSLALLDEDVEFDAPLLALLPENLRVGVLTRRACRYWNEIAIRFNDYATASKDECTFPPPPSTPINRPCHIKFSCELVAYFTKEKIGFVAWVAYAGEFPKPWKKYEPMVKARVFAPSTRGEALNAKLQPRGKDQKLLSLPLPFLLPYLKRLAPQ